MSRRALIVPLAGLALLAADAAAAAGRGKPSEVRPLVSLPDANGERQLVAPLAPCDPAQLTAAQLAALARRLWRPEPGVALVVPAPPGASDEERWTDFRGAQDRLQATASSTLQGRQDRYGPARACDGDPRTAWVEGAADDGEGEWLQLELDSLFADRAAYDRARQLRDEGAELQRRGELAQAVDRYRQSLALYPDDRLEAHVRRIEQVLGGQ